MIYIDTSLEYYKRMERVNNPLRTASAYVVKPYKSDVGLVTKNNSTMLKLLDALDALEFYKAHSQELARRLSN